MRMATEAGEGDLEAYVIYLAVFSANIGRVMRDPSHTALHSSDTPVPNDLRMPVSRRAIAESVGLPRETVRRKISALIAEGCLVERDGGVVAVGPVLEQRGNMKFVLGVTREFARVSAELNRCAGG
jgi:hypothetical protein